MQPTLFAKRENRMRVAQEEIFGPVLTAIPFDDEAEALALANDVRYGLAGYSGRATSARAHRVRALRSRPAWCWVNSENNRHLPTPFGGMKASGIGRDGGDYSFDFYMETKNICVAHGTHTVPTLGSDEPLLRPEAPLSAEPRPRRAQALRRGPRGAARRIRALRTRSARRCSTATSACSTCMGVNGQILMHYAALLGQKWDEYIEAMSRACASTVRCAPASTACLREESRVR